MNALVIIWVSRLRYSLLQLSGKAFRPMIQRRVTSNWLVAHNEFKVWVSVYAYARNGIIGCEFQNFYFGLKQSSVGARRILYGTHSQFVSAEGKDIMWDRHNPLWPMTGFQAAPGRTYTPRAVMLNVWLENASVP